MTGDAVASPRQACSGTEAPGIVGLLGPILAMSRHLRGHRGLFLTVVLTVWAGLILSVTTVMLSVAAASALASSPSGDGADEAARTAAALCAGVTVLGLLAWFEQWFAHVLAYRVIDTIRLRVHRAIARLAPLGLAHRRSGETVAAAMTDVESLEWFYAHTAAQVLAGCAACVTVAGACLAWLGPEALIVPAAQALVVAVPVLLLPRAARQGARLRAAVAELSAHALAARAHARETVLLDRLGAVSQETHALTRRVQEARRALAVRAGTEQALIEVLSVGVVLLMLRVATDSASRGGLAPGAVPVVVALAGMSLVPATAVTGALGRLGETSAAARRVDELITTPGLRPTAPESPGPGAQVSTGSATGRQEASLRVHGLRVRYPGASRPVLDGLDLEVRPGETLAVVGASGAGKTTLALCLARLVAPEAGRIVLGGVDVAQEDPERTRERLVLVTQHTDVLRASVRDNLLCPEAPDDQVWQALTRARLADRVRALPEGLDTVLAERGAAWSGGERQRLGLARGLLRDPEVLVLDEPTAGLDARTENEFLQALAEGRRGRTTVVVTHRRAVMRACDRVVVVEAGAVVAAGDHAHLLRTSSAYRAVLDEAQEAPDAPAPGGEPVRGQVPAEAVPEVEKHERR